MNFRVVSGQNFFLSMSLPCCAVNRAQGATVGVSVSLLYFSNMDSMDSFEFWLRRMESKLERNARRPTTREDADDLWEITKVGLESRYILTIGFI